MIQPVNFVDKEYVSLLQVRQQRGKWNYSLADKSIMREEKEAREAAALEEAGA